MTDRSPDFAHPFAALAPVLAAAAREAGAIALRSFRPGAHTSARVWSKSGGSPVTAADMAVDAFLKDRLGAALPEAGWLSEETADDRSRMERRLVWIVDPIDGTRAFLGGHPDWCVAAALLMEGRPTLGVVYAPASDTLYEAALGGGARRDGRPIRVTPAESLAGARTAGPKPLVDRLEREAGRLARLERIPSLALRLARVADGAVDVGLVSSDSRDWDLAAADLILQEAGGLLTDLTGETPLYNRPEPIHGELAASSRRLQPRVVEALSSGGTARGAAAPTPASFRIP